MNTPKILDVGQCGFDGPRMAELWRTELHAHVDSASTGADALEAVAHTDYDLVLVNRILAKDGASGLDVIKELRGFDSAVPIMLVSDLPDAQQKAVALGAIEGFGKSELESPATLQRVAKVVNNA